MTVGSTRSNVTHTYSSCTLKSQIPILLALRPPVAEWQAYLNRVHQMTPKWHWILWGQWYPINVLLVPKDPNLNMFCSTASLFRDKCSKRLPNDLEHHRIKGVPLYARVVLLPPSQKFYSILLYKHSLFSDDSGAFSSVPNFNPFHLMSSRFQVTDYLGIIAPNEMAPKWHWTQGGQRSRHICSTSIPKHQISIHFTLRPDIWIIVHFETISTQNDHKMALHITMFHWTPQPPSLKLHPISIFG